MTSDFDRVQDKILFHKKKLIGYTKTNNYDKKRHRIFLETTIEEKNKKRVSNNLKNINNYKTLSISGNSKHFGGQIYDELDEKKIDFTIDKTKIKEIKEIWKKYHLNDVKAGTDLQEKTLKKMKGNYSYDNAVNYLKGKNIYNDRGYKYGHGWLVKPLPKKIESKIKELLK